METFKIITSIALSFLLLVTIYLLGILFIFNFNEPYFYLFTIIFMLFLILTIIFITKKRYSISFILSYSIVNFYISYSIFDNKLLIKFIPFLLSLIYMLLNRKKA